LADKKRNSFNSSDLEGLCKVIADTDNGLTGSEIGQILRQIRVIDVDPNNTKWKRLFNALANKQNEEKCGNVVLVFINNALQPTRFISRQDNYRSILQGVNTILLFHGLIFKEDGNFHTSKKATDLSEAENKAATFKKKLLDRNLHIKLLKYCKSELIKDNYFHAVLEATKSIASLIREKTGLYSDGSKLCDEAFSGSNPLIAINDFSTESKRMEQRGFNTLAKGLFGTFRNPTAHAAKIEWNMTEEDALDLFSLASYILRRIDSGKTSC
jgi:uncharacterized protein (TIGR02391 family)